MATELEQRALKTLAQIKGHVAWRKGGIHRVPSIVEMSEWAEVVAALQQAGAPPLPEARGAGAVVGELRVPEKGVAFPFWQDHAINKLKVGDYTLVVHTKEARSNGE